jgi:uncharacterized membrane protein
MMLRLSSFLSPWEIQGIAVAYKTLLIDLMVTSITAVFIVTVFALTKAISDKSKVSRWHTFGSSFTSNVIKIAVFGLIGAFSGQLGGASRDGVVGDVLPAVFTLFGAYLVYYFGSKPDTNSRIALTSLSFLICFFSTYNIASVMRQKNENWTFCRSVYSDPRYNTEDLWKQLNEVWGDYCQSVFYEWTNVGAVTNNAASVN